MCKVSDNLVVVISQVKKMIVETKDYRLKKKLEEELKVLEEKRKKYT